MITCFLKGGLGNQLFQICTVIATARKYGLDYMFDFNQFQGAKQGNPPLMYSETIYHRLPAGTINENSFYLYREPHFHYHPLPSFPKDANIVLNGYFQSYKYFENEKDYLHSLFSPSSKIQDEINKKYGDVLSQKTVAIGVRRGDYLNYPHLHPPCSNKYFDDAKAIIPRSDKYLIFSDDYEWCRNVFTGDEYIFVEESDYMSFYLMMRCNSFIIPNSSFHWFGAWLSESSEVISPKTWFGPASHNDIKDLIPETWKRI